MMEGENKSYRAGEVIFNQGEKGGSFLIIESGSVEVYQESMSGKVPLVCLGPGEVLGLLTFYDERPRMASARARTDTTGKLICKEGRVSPKIPSWVNILLREFAVRLDQVNSLYSRTVNTNRSLSNQIFDNLFISSQVAALVCELAETQAYSLDNGRSVLLIEPMIEKVQELLGYKKEEILDVFHVFCQQGLLKKEIEPDHNKEVISLEGAKRLNWYTSFVRMSRSGKVKKMIDQKPPYKDRRVLIGLREFAAKKGFNITETVYIPLEVLVNEYEKECKMPLSSMAIESGIRLGLLEKLKKDSVECLVFHPQNLVRTIVALNVIHQLKKHPEARSQSPD